MNQYILLIQNNAKTLPQEGEWSDFFGAARTSGIFKGGSEVGEREFVGNVKTAQPTDYIVGYMRFDTDEKSKILDLLKIHPVVLNGGTVELCEMPKS